MEENYQIGSASKRRKLNEICTESKAEVVASVSNQEQTLDIFKLPVELFQYIFDNLRLSDLLAVGQTCKWFNKVAGQHYQLNYPGPSARYQTKTKFIINYIHPSHNVNLSPFIQFIEMIDIHDTHSFQNFLQNYSKFHQLKILDLSSIVFSNVEFNGIKMKMSQVEKVVMENCKITKNISENFLDSFPNLKRLVLKNNEWIDGNDDQWLIRKYPTLKHLEFFTLYYNTSQFATTLELNPDIRVFETTATCLWRNRHSIRNAKVSLDELSIHFIYHKIEEDAQICQFLNELQARGFYKRLKVSCGGGETNMEEPIKELARLKSMIRLFVLTYDTRPITLTSFSDLRELILRDSIQIDLDSIVSNLEDLELIYFQKAKLTHLMPAFSRAKKLKKIKIDILQDGGHFNESTNTIALSALNKERKKLRDATKITLYVISHVYYATKASCQTNLDLIDLRCLRSYCWCNRFNNFRHTL